eukprot:6208874-Pleurochrysis_carterae.AAC.1
MKCMIVESALIRDVSPRMASQTVRRRATEGQYNYDTCSVKPDLSDRCMVGMIIPGKAKISISISMHVGQKSQSVLAAQLTVETPWTTMRSYGLSGLNNWYCCCAGLQSTIADSCARTVRGLS